MKKAIIQYHLSYSDKENMLVHNFFENSSEKELVNAIRELQKIYAEHFPDINERFKNLENEIRVRNILNQKYEALKECRNEWNKYQTALLNYKTVLIIRQKYAEFKTKYKRTTVFRRFITEYQDKIFPGYTENFVHRAVLSENAKCYIKKPLPPKIFSSIKEIEVIPLSNDASLESIGKDNLKYLLKFMLAYVDSQYEIVIPVSIFFLTRKYSQRSHKKGKRLPPFATTLLSYSDLVTANPKLLKDIKKIEQDCKDILAEIEKINN